MQFAKIQVGDTASVENTLVGRGLNWIFWLHVKHYVWKKNNVHHFKHSYSESGDGYFPQQGKETNQSYTKMDRAKNRTILKEMLSVTENTWTKAPFSRTTLIIPEPELQPNSLEHIDFLVNSIQNESQDLKVFVQKCLLSKLANLF